jgi:hypothetical protein
MPDFDAIAVALAGRFAASAVTPPTGYANVRASTPYPPAAMVPLPAVFVVPPEGGFEHGPMLRHGDDDWTVRFYYSQTGTPERDAKALLKWATVLTDQLKGAVKLGGLSGATWEVTSAHVVGYRIGKLSYGDQDYSGIELSVHTVTNEAWAATA